MGIQEELRNVIRSENVLAEQLASSIEELMGMGFEVGKVSNSIEVVRQIEERIAQTRFAISILDDEKHAVPKRDLQSILDNYYYPALENAHNRLRQATEY
jgi:hypothetical protein